MKKTWPKDNLLDNMADEYAGILYPHWDFSKYGLRNPWAFRLACRDSLRVTDDGEVFIEPGRLVENLDYFMGGEIRRKEGCLDEDEPYPDRIKTIRTGMEEIILEALNESELTDGEIDDMIGKRGHLEDLVTSYVEEIKASMLCDFNKVHRTGGRK